MKQFRWGLFKSWRFWVGIAVANAFMVLMMAHLPRPFSRYLPFPPWINRPIAFLVALIPLIGLFAWGLRHVLPRRLRLNLLDCGVPICVACGYSLRGLPLPTECCPECGRPLDESVRRILVEQPSSTGAAHSGPDTEDGGA